MRRVVAAVLLLAVLVAPASAAEPRPATWFFGNDRIYVANTTIAPYRQTVYIEAASGSTASVCTGALIGPRTVLTAAHCLYQGGAYRSSVVVAPGRNGSLHPYGYQFATGWIVPPGYRLTQATEYDVGLVVLPDSTYGATLGWFTVGVVSDATLYASAFIAPGYDEDALPAYSMVLRGGGFSSVTLTRLNFLSSATHGASGAPILRASDSLLLGVLQGGTDGSGPVGPPNYGRRVDTDVTAFLADGCTILACTFSAYVEPSPITPTSTPIPAPASATPTAIATRSPTPTPTPIARLRIYVPVALR